MKEPVAKIDKTHLIAACHQAIRNLESQQKRVQHLLDFAADCGPATPIVIPADEWQFLSKKVDER